MIKAGVKLKVPSLTKNFSKYVILTNEGGQFFFWIGIRCENIAELYFISVLIEVKIIETSEGFNNFKRQIYHWEWLTRGTLWRLIIIYLVIKHNFQSIDWKIGLHVNRAGRPLRGHVQLGGILDCFWP